jgi:hypothetical protein
MNRSDGIWAEYPTPNLNREGLVVLSYNYRQKKCELKNESVNPKICAGLHEITTDPYAFLHG